MSTELRLAGPSIRVTEHMGASDGEVSACLRSNGTCVEWGAPSSAAYLLPSGAGPPVPSAGPWSLTAGCNVVASRSS